MATTYDKRDLMVNHRYDLVMVTDSNGNGDIARTNVSSPFHTWGQSMYIALQTEPGQFKLSSTFGASPKRFLGMPVTQQIFADIEQHIGLGIRTSGVNGDAFPITIKSAPLTRDRVVVRIEAMHPNKPGIVVNRVDMLYSTSDNRVYPLYNAFGGNSG